METKKRKSPYDPRLNTLARICMSRIDDLLDELNVNVTISGNKYIGICPIHGDSDNEGTLNIYYDGDTVPGFWKCRSRGCHEKFGMTIIGFVRGRLSAMQLGYHWVHKPKNIISFSETLKYLCKFANVRIEDIQVDKKEEERLRFISECKSQVNKIHSHSGKLIHRSLVKKNLMIPSEYFLKRNYDESILKKYDVGMARKSKKETENRVIVPIYNEDQYLIGYTCRSIFDRCEKCKLFHADECPIEKDEKRLCSKWRHMGFNPEEVLYNYWEAKPFIKNTNTAILVEGPGDVWRLEQNGIHNAVGIFGNSLYDNQERLLANAQCMAIIVLTDSDEAGRAGAEEIKKKYGRLYRMYFPKINAHDAGDLNEDAITESIKPIMEKIEEVYHK